MGFLDNATIGEDTEKRMCKCLFYKNIEYATEVSNKKLKEFMQNFSILDIEKEKEKRLKNRLGKSP